MVLLLGAVRCGEVRRLSMVGFTTIHAALAILCEQCYIVCRPLFSHAPQGSVHHNMARWQRIVEVSMWLALSQQKLHYRTMLSGDNSNPSSGRYSGLTIG